jgi:hypothetical protein
LKKKCKKKDSTVTLYILSTSISIKIIKNSFKILKKTKVMRKFASLFILGLSVILLTASCGGESIEIKDPSTSRGVSGTSAQAVTEMQSFMLNGQEVKIDATSIMTAMANENANQAAEDATNIVNSLMGADKEAQTLDVKFSMADEPVQNGMFVFGMETENPKNLTMQMFDEEGFGMVANNEFDINQGNNFKALNVSALSSGNYIFRLKDADGKELQKTVTVANK